MEDPKNDSKSLDLDNITVSVPILVTKTEGRCGFTQVPSAVLPKLFA
jgi:hypothetical protein